MTSSPLPHATKERVLWIDALRGVTIILVVLFHAMLVYRGGVGVIPAEDLSANALVELNKLFKTVRMPAFFFCSGLVFTMAYGRGWGWFIERRVRFALWVILIWTMIAFAVELLGLHLYPHRPTPYLPVHRLIWVPYCVLWFLYAVLITSTLAMALRTFPYLIRAAVVIALMAFCSWLQQNYKLPGGLRLLVGGLAQSALPFFMLGVWHGPQILRLIERRGAALALQLGGLAVAVAVSSAIRPQGIAQTLLVGLPATLGFIASIRLFALWQAGAKQLARVGSCSLEVFLIHPFILALGVLCLRQVAPIEPVPGFAAMALLTLWTFGVLGSLVMGKMLRRLSGDFLFDAPRPKVFGLNAIGAKSAA